jgi:diguanylate cyclase (GGDEF)-like protein/PAS domain S-box-containing protein
MSFHGSERREVRDRAVLDLLHRIADVANRAERFSDALEGITREVCAYSGWCAGHAFVVKGDAPGGPRLISVDNWHFSGETRLESLRRRAPFESFAPGQGLPGVVWDRRVALSVVEPHTTDRRFARMRGLPVRGWFGFPVISADRVEGVVEFCTTDDRPMHPHIVTNANIIGSLLASAYMRERLRFFRMAVDNAHDAFTVYRVTHDPKTPLVIAYVSPTFERQTGYSVNEVQDQPKQLLHGPETDTEYADAIVKRVLSGDPVEADILKYRKDGSKFWAHVTMRPIIERGNIEFVVAVQREITERKRWEQQLELLSTALRQANDMIAMLERGADDRWRFSYVNDLFVRTTGFSRHEVLGRDTRFMEGPQTDRELLRDFRETLVRGEMCRVEIAFYKKDGTLFWVDLNARPIIGRDGSTTHSIVLYHDITEFRRRAELLSHEAAHDSLTGLRNRRYFARALENALHGPAGYDRRHALLFMDLDRFKQINDGYGHDAGDRVLIALGERLHASMREGDVLARLGGDEFAVLLHDCSADAAQRVAKHLLEIVHALRVPWGETHLSVGMSIGIAPCVPGDLPAGEALRRADAACYAAKKRGGDCVEPAQVEA